MTLLRGRMPAEELVLCELWVLVVLLLPAFAVVVVLLLGALLPLGCELLGLAALGVLVLSDELLGLVLLTGFAPPVGAFSATSGCVLAGRS